MNSAFSYEPRPRTGKAPPKHKWGRAEPGFLERPGGEIEGMCPTAMGVSTLESLLNEGVKHYVKAKGLHPCAIFNVHDGVPYKAYPTRPGFSFHGFPCRRRDVPPEAYEALLTKASEKNCKPDVLKWFKMHP